MSRAAITLDVDWAPDFMIDAAAQALVDREVKATWFVTHASPAVERLREHPDLFELGIHPNFLAGSSHGATPAACPRGWVGVMGCPTANPIGPPTLHPSGPRPTPRSE